MSLLVAGAVAFSINHHQIYVPDKISNLRDERIGVVFLHYCADPVTLRNLESFREWNPDLTIVTVTSGERIEGGYSIHDDETFSRHWREQTTGDNDDLKNRSGDLLLYYWYQNRRERCDRWLVVEWDAFCSMPAREFIEPVAAYPFVAASIRVRRRERQWVWFSFVKTLPPHLRSFAMGVVPSAFLIFKDEVLDKLVKLVPWDNLSKCNAELRLGTLAHAAGYPAVAHPLGGANIVWLPLPLMNPIPPGRWHPIKYLVPRTGSHEEPRYLKPVEAEDLDSGFRKPPIMERVVGRLYRMARSRGRTAK